jgi:uncharacterized membrane protein
MTEQSHAQIDRYMARFEAALRRHRAPEPAEIAADLRGHVGEAIQYGKSPESVLASLGPADALARAYALELLAEPPADRPAGVAGRVGLFVRRAVLILAVLAASGFVTMIVTVVLGMVGLAVALTGVAFLVIGAVELVGLHIPGTHLGPIPPLAAIGLAPVALAVGLAMLWALWRYARLLARLLIATLPLGR